MEGAVEERSREVLILSSETESVGTGRKKGLLIPPSEMEGVGEGERGEGAAKMEEKYMTIRKSYTCLELVQLTCI